MSEFNPNTAADQSHVCPKCKIEFVTRMPKCPICYHREKSADHSRVIEELETAIEQFLAWFGSGSQWERENRNAKPVTRKDVRGLRDALRFKDAEAKRIMEGK